MKKLKNRFLYKINNRGFGHHIVLPLIVIAVIAGVGAKIILSSSHADALSSILYCANNAKIYDVNPANLSSQYLGSGCSDFTTPLWGQNEDNVFMIAANNDQLVSINRNSLEHTTIFTTPSNYVIVGNAYSQSSNKIALLETAPNVSTQKILLMNADGSDVKTIFNDTYGHPYGIDSMSWSPNGKGLLFNSPTPKYSHRLVLYNVASGQAKVIYTYAGSALSPDGFNVSDIDAWSNDSNNIYGIYNTQKIPENIAVLNINTKIVKLLTDETYAMGDVYTIPSVSPDGTKIAAQRLNVVKCTASACTENFQLVVMNTSGTDLKVIYTYPPSEVASGDSIDWSPGSSQIAFLDYEGVLREINANGGLVKVIAGNPASNAVKVTTFDWSIQ